MAVSAATHCQPRRQRLSWTDMLLVSRLRILAPLLASLSLGALEARADPADFFCRPISGQTPRPTFFDARIKDRAGAASVNTGLCLQDVDCAFVPATIRSQATADYLRESESHGRASGAGSSVPEQAMARLLDRYSSSLTWHRSRVACAGQMGPMGPVCPPADRCKSDPVVREQPATTEPAFGNAESPAAPVAGSAGSAR